MYIFICIKTRNQIEIPGYPCYRPADYCPNRGEKMSITFASEREI